MVRIKRLLELLSSYSFNFITPKGKDMILGDFLARQKHDDSNPHDIIFCSSFNMHNILQERYYNLGLTDKYVVQAQSQTKSSRIILPEVHGIKKIFDTQFTTRKADKQLLKLKRVVKLNHG